MFGGHALIAGRTFRINSTRQSLSLGLTFGPRPRLQPPEPTLANSSSPQRLGVSLRSASCERIWQKAAGARAEKRQVLLGLGVGRQGERKPDSGGRLFST